MFPPSERGFKREAGATPTQLSAAQKVVRYAESNDFLLYLTAIFGVVMPAVMYYFYRAVHRRYHEYSSKKKAAKRKAKRTQKRSRKVTVFYLASSVATKKVAYELAEEWDEFDPIVSPLNESTVQQHVISGMTAAIYILPDGAEAGSDFDAFMDFLDEVRYERRQKTFMRNVMFSTFSLGRDTSRPLLLEKKLAGLKSRPLSSEEECENKSEGNDEERVRAFATSHKNLLRQFYYGLYDDESGSDSQRSANEDASTSEDAQTEEEEDR